MKVVYSGTKNLYPCMRGAMLSLLRFNPDAKIYALAEDDELPFDFPGHLEVINVSQQKYFASDCPNMKNQFTYMALIRSCLPDILPDERVIQLDVDTIVCDSLEPMWETDLTGKWLGWVEEVYGRWKPFGKRYFNFGVAVLNLEQMREDNAVDMMVKELNKTEYPYIDQDVMNLFAVPDKTVELPVRFNESFCCGYTKHPAVVHYAGYPNWYIYNGMPRWWMRDEYKNL